MNKSLFFNDAMLNALSFIGLSLFLSQLSPSILPLFQIEAQIKFVDSRMALH